MTTGPQASSKNDPEMQDVTSLKDLAKYLSTSLLSQQLITMDKTIRKLPGHKEMTVVHGYLKPAMVSADNTFSSLEEDDAKSKNSEDSWTTLFKAAGRNKTQQSSSPTEKFPESSWLNLVSV